MPIPAIRDVKTHRSSDVPHKHRTRQNKTPRPRNIQIAALRTSSHLQYSQTAPAMPPQTRIAAVTGANKGIGLAISAPLHPAPHTTPPPPFLIIITIPQSQPRPSSALTPTKKKKKVRNLALAYPASALARDNAPLLIYLTARSAPRGLAALEALHADPSLASAKVLARDGGPVSLAFQPLDVGDAASIDAFAAQLRAAHGRVDVLVNNAGVAMDGFGAAVARGTLRTNYWGAVRAMLAVLPLVRAARTGRVVNVASAAGALGKYSDGLRERFRDAAEAAAGTGEEVVAPTDAIMREFEEGVEAGDHEKKGFPSAAYAVSKAGLIGATRAVGLWEKSEAEKEGRPVRAVNSCCPGWVNTDMTKGKGTRSVDEGAKTPVFLALGDLDGVVGEFWRDEKVVEW